MHPTMHAAMQLRQAQVLTTCIWADACETSARGAAALQLQILNLCPQAHFTLSEVSSMSGTLKPVLRAIMRIILNVSAADIAASACLLPRKTDAANLSTLSHQGLQVTCV